MSQPIRGWRMQLVIASLGALLWSIYPEPTWTWMLGCYLVAWTLLNALSQGQAWRKWHLTSPPLVGLCILMVLPAGSRLYRQVEILLDREHLANLDHHFQARLRLESLPSIAPPLLRTDQPQTFLVRASAGQEIHVRFGNHPARILAHEIHNGLYRLRYNPREHGIPETRDGDLDVILETNDRHHTRNMHVVTPLAHPRWLRLSPSGSMAACVSEETDEVVVVDRNGLVLRARVGDGPSDLSWFDNAHLLVGHRYENDAWLMDIHEHETPQRISVGPWVRSIDCISNERCVVARAGPTPGFLFVDREGTKHDATALPFTPTWVRFGETSEQLIVASRRPAALHHWQRDHGQWRNDRSPLRLSRPPVTLALSNDRRQAIVSLTDFQPEGREHVGNHFIQDRLLWINLTTWQPIRDLLTQRRSPRQRHPGDIDLGVSPMGISTTSDGATHVVFAGTDDLWRIPPDGGIPEIHSLTSLPIPNAHGIARLRDGSYAISSPSYGTLAILRPNRELREVLRLAPPDRTLRHENQSAYIRRVGESVFYESTRAGVACQSCHLHADSDQARHNIGGYEMVGTLSVRGLMGTPPYLRDGGYPTLGSLDELAQTLYRGYLRRQPGRRRALHEYLESLPRTPPKRLFSTSDPARESRGARAFERAGCPLCHTYPAFTNLGSHPAAAIFPEWSEANPGVDLDVPSLLALSSSAPYLLDGRAPTLREVLEDFNAQNRHGDTRSLTPEERDDLIYFLEGL